MNDKPRSSEEDYFLKIMQRLRSEIATTEDPACVAAHERALRSLRITHGTTPWVPIE